MTKLDKLSCQSCGAPLQVPESSRFVTCNHCSTRLAVRRTETATFTEMLESLEAGQVELRDRLQRVELESRLAQLERDWDQVREKLIGAGGEPPTVMSLVLPAVCGVGVAVMMIAFGEIATGIVAGAVGLGVSVWTYWTMKNYDDAFGRYRKSRLKLVYELEAARNPAANSSPPST